MPSKSEKGLISVPRDKGWKDLTNPRRPLTDAELDKRIKQMEKKERKTWPQR